MHQPDAKRLLQGGEPPGCDHGGDAKPSRGLGEAAAACRCGEDEDFVEVHCIEIRYSAIYDGDTTANFDKAIDQAHLSSEKGK
ncbi:hypothetical protein D9M70_552990 [compost metagenome]